MSPADPRACAVAEQGLCAHALRTAGAAGRSCRPVCRSPAAALCRQLQCCRLVIDARDCEIDGESKEIEKFRQEESVNGSSLKSVSAVGDLD